MYLQRIELQGFKSFAQKAVLEFPAPGKGCKIAPNINTRSSQQLARGVCGVTAIVGPNGSGKSNVVDAVRWVLGEQSLKLLRGKKSTDVIFSGSAQKSSLGLAEVSLYLNNEDGSAPIDYSEIVITRRIYRDGSSEYLLNKSEVRLFDIIMLLAKANFGQNTYSVIGQGMVDQIVNYSSAERKEFFDEATGVKQYQIKRDRSVGKLKRSRENMEQVKGLIEELAPHLKSLTRQVNRWRKRQVIEVELRDWQIKYYGKLWLDLDAGYQILALDFSIQEKEKIKLESAINDLQEKINQFGEEGGRGEEFNRLENEYSQKNAQRNSLAQQLAEVKGKLDVEYLKIGKPDLSWLENRQEELSGQIKNLEQQMAILEQQIGRQQEIFQAKTKDQAKILAEFQELEDALLNLQKEFRSDLGVSEKEIRQAVNRIYSLQKDFIGKLKTTHDLASLAKLKIEAEMVFGEVESFYRQISQENKRQQSEEMGQLQERLSAVLKNKDHLASELSEAKVKLEVALSQKKSLLAKSEELKADLAKIKNDLAKNKLTGVDRQKINQSLAAEKEALAKQIGELDEAIAAVKQKIDRFNETEEEKRKEIFAVQQAMHQKQINYNEVVNKLNEIKIELTRVETKKEDLFVSLRTDLGADYRPKIDKGLQAVNLEESGEKIEKLKKQLELIGGIDAEVETEYQTVKERYDFLAQQNDDLEKAIKDLEKVVVELDKIIKKQFQEEFKKINQDFSRYFKKLFVGGSARLVLSQKEKTEAEAAREELSQEVLIAEETPDLTENKEEKIAEKETKQVEDQSYLANMGIEIEACPPGKKIKNINMLSGGEKTMTALALICSIIANNPSPFILFDEVDAALDESNSTKFSDIVEELAHKTQFITITHNRAIMSRADVLYGVTMQGDGVSRLLSLKLEEAEKITKK